MPAGTVQPSFDAILRLCNCFANRAFGGCAVSICRCPSDMRFSPQTLSQVVISLPDVLAKNVSTGSLVTAQVTHCATGRMTLYSASFRGRGSRPAIRRCGLLARDQSADAECDHNKKRSVLHCKQLHH
jgi:hypothetical protein